MIRIGLLLSILLGFAALGSTGAIAESLAEQECVATQMTPLSTSAMELSSSYMATAQKTMKLNLNAATKKQVCQEALAIRDKGEAIKASVRAIRGCKDPFQTITNVDMVLKDTKAMISENCGPDVK